MKLGVIGDLHLSDRPPRNRTPTYTEDVLTKLDWSIRNLKAEGCENLLFLGDVFHSKTAGRTSHALVRRVLEIFNQFWGEIWIVPGNHDFAASLESLDRQPLGVVLENPKVHLLVGLCRVLGRHFYGVPGIPLNEVNLPVLDRYDVLVLHQAVTKPGESLPYEHYLSRDIWDRAPVILNGHDHRRIAPYSVGGTLFCNPGALSRGTTSHDDLTRQPGVAVLDLCDNSIKMLDVPCKPVEEVFLLAQVARKAEKEDRIAGLVERLKSVAVEALTRERIEQLLIEKGIDRLTKGAVLNLLDAVE